MLLHVNWLYSTDIRSALLFVHREQLSSSLSFPLQFELRPVSIYLQLLVSFVCFHMTIFTVRNSSCRKVMFSQASVSHSVHRWGGVHVGAMHGRGVCGGGHTWQGVCAWWRACMAGGGVAGGMYGGGHAWQGMCVCEVCMAGVCMVGETVTAADGTHPTGNSDQCGCK